MLLLLVVLGGRVLVVLVVLGGRVLELLVDQRGRVELHPVEVDTVQPYL